MEESKKEKLYGPGDICGYFDVTVKMRMKLDFSLNKPLTEYQLKQYILENWDYAAIDCLDEEIWSIESVQSFDLDGIWKDEEDIPY